MEKSAPRFERLHWIGESVWFCKTHFLTLFGLGLVAALGRAVQLGAFGPIATSSHLLLEVVIESTRLLTFLYALGLTNVRTGAARVVHMFTQRASRQKNGYIAWQKFKKEWFALLLNLVAFLLMAWIFNFMIDYVAYQTCLYAKLKANQLIDAPASEWALILFLKNISVIPFTLVTNALFVLWMTNRLNRS